MYWSKSFIPTIKETPLGTEAVSHQLLLRAGCIHMLTSGVYSYLPLGFKVLSRVDQIITEEMDAVGAQKLFLPCLQPIELWKQTGRDETLKEVMIRFQDKRGRHMCLGPTHEEVITDLVKNFVQSYKQLPVVLYQIQTKFRDEIRTRFGIVRACEFIMKDAYSFDRDKKGMEINYQLMYETYTKIFHRLGLPVAVIEADSGAMGGDVSHEFLVPADIGEDTIMSCPACGRHQRFDESYPEPKCDHCGKGPLQKQVAIELGHIFQLGTKYSEALEALYLDESGVQKPIIMGCYGIGVSRVIAAIVEAHHDEKGIIWPKEVAPYVIEILPLPTPDDQASIMALTEQYYSQFRSQGLDVLVDDRPESAGRKFNDADLIGVPVRLTLGKRNLSAGKVEIKLRQSSEVILVNREEALGKIMELLKDYAHA